MNSSPPGADASSKFLGRVEQLSLAQRARLLARLHNESAAQRPGIRRGRDDNRVLLSSPQESLWLLEQLYGPAHFFSRSCPIQLLGRLDAAVLERSLEEVVRRHDVLRMTIQAADGRPQGVIGPTEPVRIPVVDGAQRVASGEDWLDRAQMEAACLPFDPARGPLWRATLFHVGPDAHVLLVSVHQLAFDASSALRLLDELATAYAAFVQNQPCPLPPLPMQYADFAEWEHHRLSGPAFEAELAFWRNRLGEAMAELALPTDHPRPARLSGLGGVIRLRFSEATCRRIEALAGEENATPFMVLFGALHVLLQRLSGQEELVIGTAFSLRDAPECRELIGNFINLLPLRLRAVRHVTFRQWLTAVRAELADAYAHRQVPLQRVLQTLARRRDPSRNPLFQVLCNFENLPSRTITAGNLSFRLLPNREEVGPLDLALELVASGATLQGSLSYSQDLFDPATASRIASAYTTLLEALAEQADLPLSAVASAVPCLQNSASLPAAAADGVRSLSATDRRSTPSPAGATAAGSVDPDSQSSDECLHELFERQARRAPDAVAIVFEDRRLTYRELDTRADAVAAQLRARGVGSEMLVGLCLERSENLLVGLLGILKAGGAYLPLETTLPERRLAALLQEAQPALILTQDPHATRFETLGCTTISLDDLRDDSSAAGPLAATGIVRPENLAYVIYTSGSTGRPKGVAVEHRHISRYLTSLGTRLALKPGMTYATVSTIAADLGNTVIFASLAYGGCLHVISRERAADPIAFADYLRLHLIDCLKITPSHLAALIPPEGQTLPLPRRVLVLGGEASRCDWIAALQRQAPDCAIYNHYGPTETTIGVVMGLVDAGALAPPSGMVLLGDPLPHAAIWLLDPEGNPVAAGEPGEIYIGGGSVARGYVRQARETAEVFVPDPFSVEPGARFYRTGDRARRRPDSSLEFLGRLDEQVKVRGYRVEPPEIESVLREHPGVREAVVRLRPLSPGNVGLVAYVVPHQYVPPSVATQGPMVLPNGLVVAQLNRSETRYLYEEIFEQQAYLRHGITLGAGACVFDVGANIGLFTLFVHQVCARPQVYAFEPNPMVWGHLRANVARLGDQVRLFDFGLSAAEGAATLTGFDGFSLFSGFHTDAEREKSIVRRFLENQSTPDDENHQTLRQGLTDLLDERFKARSFPARLRPLSSVLAELEIQRIDLLKINVEKSELEVLRGIRNEDWPRIRQIVVEVDRQAHLGDILDLLRAHGFECATDQDPRLRTTDLCYVYALRPSPELTLIPDQPPGVHRRALPRFPEPIVQPESLRSFALERLPEPLVPSRFVLLERLPLTSNGKLDVQALPGMEALAAPVAEEAPAPTSEIERCLAGIWQEILGCRSPRVHDDFFELGGHSLLAAQVITRIRKALGVELPLREVFDHPTLAGLAAAVAGRARKADRSPAPVPRAEPGPSPLSREQEQIWFFSRLRPELPLYHECAAIRIPGQLDAAALRASLEELTRRHEILRTTFVLQGERPVQLVQPEARLPLVEMDLAAGKVADPAAEAMRQASQDSQRAFPLDQAPLMRALLARVAEGEHWLFLTFHHIVIDGVSLYSILLRELRRLYDAFQRGQASPLPAPAYTYRDYVQWQAAVATEPHLQSQLAYWKKRLAGLPPLQLPTDRPRPRVASYGGELHPFTLGADLTARLQRLSQAEHVTLFVTLTAAFKALLWRYAPQPDITLGTVIGSRKLAEFEEIIGNFLNVVALRTDMEGALTFRDLLGRVKQTMLEALAHADAPFPQLVAELGVKRDESSNPVFQVALVLEPPESADEAGWTFLHQAGATGLSKFDLTLLIEEREGILRGTFEYSTDLFDRQTIRRMAEHYRRLLEAFSADASVPLSAPSLLTPQELAEQLGAWNATEAPYRRQTCLHELFAEQAARTPDRVALEADHQAVTYRTLDVASNEVARRLRRLGVGPEDLVALCLERSTSLVAGVLGILKAGGAYVPLDPDYPEERLLFLLRDAKPTVLLTSARLAPRLLSCDCRVLLIDEPRGEGDTQPADLELASGVTSENLAYVMYTSGSTGSPKGVMVTHHNVLNVLTSVQERFRLTERDVVLSLATFCFDISVAEIFLPLAVGAKLVIADRETAADGRRLARRLEESGATFIQPTPATYRLLLEAGWAGKPGLTMVSTGERLTADLAQRLVGRGSTLWNLYGPTETTIWSTGVRVENPREIITIGRPLANTRALILDANMQLLPVGAAGELFLGGDGLARGYLGRPDLTAERFVPDPFSKVAGARLYRTGDLSRFLPDGSIEFLGRLDHQVKIRGYRIELGEIESALSQHPRVRTAAVVATDTASDEPRLVAHVVADLDRLIAVRELRTFLKGKLPEYMVPAEIVLRDRLPLTANGKVDRRALMADKPPVPEDRVEPLAEGSEMQRRMIELWRGLLNVATVRLEDSFFDLGGHSLLAMRLIARVERAFGVAPPLRSLFEQPTLAGFCRRCEALLREEHPSTVAAADRIQGRL